MMKRLRFPRLNLTVTPEDIGRAQDELRNPNKNKQNKSYFLITSKDVEEANESIMKENMEKRFYEKFQEYYPKINVDDLKSVEVKRNKAGKLEINVLIDEKTKEEMKDLPLFDRLDSIYKTSINYYSPFFGK